MRHLEGKFGAGCLPNPPKVENLLPQGNNSTNTDTTNMNTDTPKRKPGRPAKPREEIPSVCDGMKQASTLWGIPYEAIRIAKAAGCPGFEKSRVHRQPLLDWIAANPEALKQGEDAASGAELKKEKLAAEVALLKAKIRREEKETIPLAEALSETARFVSICQETAKALMDPPSYRAFCIQIKQRCGEYDP